MWAHVEFFDGGVIRLFRDGDSFGEPYVNAIPFKRTDDDGLIELVGVVKPPTSEQVRAMIVALRDLGIGVVRERKDGCNPGKKIMR